MEWHIFKLTISDFEGNMTYYSQIKTQDFFSPFWETFGTDKSGEKRLDFVKKKWHDFLPNCENLPFKLGLSAK